ncbi:photosynthetic complex assembly protein PuhC [Roseomonas sp. F4]
MAQTLSENPLLRRPALICSAMVAATLAFVLATPLQQHGHDGAASVALVQRDLFFADRADGGVTITDSRSGADVAVLQPGEGGFVRGTLRSLVRERRREQIGTATPFRLTAWQNGRITLEDQATGRELDLSGFGQTNAEAFVRFLTNKE